MGKAGSRRWFAWVPAITAVLCALGVDPVHAKRAAPRDVQVERDTRIYRANHWTVAAYGTAANGGVVEVFDHETNQLLSWIQVYCIRVDPKLERDVQDVFIVGLEVRGEVLIVTDELADVFEVNLKTKRVSFKKRSPTSGGPSRVHLCKP